MSRWLVMTIVWLFMSVPLAILVGKVLREGRGAGARLRRRDAGRAARPRRHGGHGGHGLCQPGMARVPTGHRLMGVGDAQDPREAAVAPGHSSPPHLISCPFGRRVKPTRRPETRGWEF